MSRIKLGLSGLSPEQLRDKGVFVLEQITGNEHFLTPNPPIAVISTSITELDEAIVASETGAHQAISIRNEKYDVLLNVMRTLAAYIQSASGGVASVITSSGFGVIAPRVPVGLPPAVINVAAATSEYPGCASLKWKSLRTKAHAYAVYATQSDPATNPQWQLIGYSSKAAFLAEQLPNHSQYYWFSVVAINAAGEGPMSDPAKCMVL